MNYNITLHEHICKLNYKMHCNKNRIIKINEGMHHVPVFLDKSILKFHIKTKLNNFSKYKN